MQGVESELELELKTEVKHGPIQGPHTILTYEVSVTAERADAAQAFRTTSLQLVGVYEECPECRKLDKWESEWRRIATGTPDLQALIGQRLQRIRSGDPRYLPKGIRG
jgi:hypothetical protein